MLPDTIGEEVQKTINEKRISQRFNPFKIADYIYFSGINPNNSLS